MRYVQSKGSANSTNDLLKAAVYKDSKITVVAVIILFIIGLLLQVNSIWGF